MDGNGNTDVATRIIIDLMRDGRVNVNGPVADKILCFGVLELAKKAIMDFKPALIQPVTGKLP